VQAGGLELVADPAELQEEDPEVVLGGRGVEVAALAAAGLRADRLGAEREGDLDVGLDLPGVQLPLEPALLDRAAEPHVVEVHPVVAGVVVGLRRAVVVAASGAVHLLEVGRALALDRREEGLVDAAAPARSAGLGDAEGAFDRLHLLFDDLDQVAEAGGVEPGGVDVDVVAATGFDLGAGLSDRVSPMRRTLPLVGA
jgi:hypothetical protein